MAGFDNDTMFAQKSDVGVFPDTTSSDNSTEFDRSGADVTSIVYNSSNTVSSSALQIIRLAGVTAANAFTKVQLGTAHSWGMGVHAAGNPLAFVCVYAANGSVTPQTYDNVPFRAEVSGGTGGVVVRSSLAVASEGERSGGSVIANIQNAETAINSDAQLLLQSGDPTSGAGGGANYIRWGAENQVQFCMGQGKDATPSTQPLEIKDGTANFAGSTFVDITPAGEITCPLTPAFLATLGSADNNVTGNGATYTLGTNVALTEIFDQNSDFNTNGTFTAPVTGRYLLRAGLYMNSLTSLMTFVQMVIVTSNRNYLLAFLNGGAVRTVAFAADLLWLGGAAIADMDAMDTATVIISIRGGAGNTVALEGNPSTNFGGKLLC